MIDNFGINSFVMYYIDKTSQIINITDNKEFKKSGNVIFIVEEKSLEKSIYERIENNLSDSKSDFIEEEYLCSLCSEKLTENPYFCYQCQKKICKKCLIDLNKKIKPFKCAFCKFELPFEKWNTFKNFMEKRKQFLGLIEENIKSKRENLIYKQKENLINKN